jgi:hypothetical protein
MTDEAQEILVSTLCFDLPDDDPDKICLVDQLVHDLNMFSGLFTVSVVCLPYHLTSSTKRS